MTLRVAAMCLAVIVGLVSRAVELVVVLGVLVPYLVVLGMRRGRLRGMGLPRVGWAR